MNFLFGIFWTVNLDKYSFEFAGGASIALGPRASPCASGRRTASSGLSARLRSSGALARITCVWEFRELSIRVYIICKTDYPIVYARAS
jgi:hypothetical protein